MGSRHIVYNIVGKVEWTARRHKGAMCEKYIGRKNRKMRENWKLQTNANSRQTHFINSRSFSSSTFCLCITFSMIARSSGVKCDKSGISAMTRYTRIESFLFFWLCFLCFNFKFRIWYIFSLFQLLDFQPQSHTKIIQFYYRTTSTFQFSNNSMVDDTLKLIENRFRFISEFNEWWRVSVRATSDNYNSMHWWWEPRRNHNWKLSALRVQLCVLWVLTSSCVMFLFGGASAFSPHHTLHTHSLPYQCFTISI